MKFYRTPEQKISNIKFPNKFLAGGIVFGILVLLAGIVYLVHFSEVFKIKSIEVLGVQSPLKEEVLEGLKNYFSNQSKISSVLGSNNILIWDNETRDFLSANPQIKNLQVTRHFFTHSVLVEAKEREKFGIWCQNLERIDNPDNSFSSSSIIIDTAPMNVVLSSDNQKCFWFDNEGIAFAESPIIESELFNRVSDFSNQKVELGRRVISEDMFENLTKIFRIMEIAEVNAKTVKLKDLFLEEVEVDSVSDPKILFSLKINPEFSLSAINSLKKSGKWEKLEYVDFRVENRAYYK